MNKIDEIFDDYFYTDDIDIDEESIDDLELKRIKEKTKNKANIRKNRIKSKYIIPLVATLVMIFSIAIVSANVDLKGLFENIFNDNYKYVQDIGKLVDAKDTKNGVTLSVDGIIGDENSMYAIFSVTRDDGTPFEADWGFFDQLNFNHMGSGGWTYDMIPDDNPNDNKLKFFLNVSMDNGIRNKDVTLKASDLVLYTNDTTPLDFNLYKYLLNYPELIGEEKQATYKDMPIGTLTDEEKKSLENEYRADNLPIGNLNIPLRDNDNSILIDNIRLDNGKLSIRFYIDNEDESDIGSPFIINNETNEKIYYTGLSNHDESFKYYTYDFMIGTMDELKNYTLGCDTTKTTEIIKENWEVTFKTDYNKQIKKLSVNRKVILDNKDFTIKNIKLSPISAVVALRESIIDKVNDPVTNLHDMVKVRLKDGSIVENNGNNISTGGINATIITMFKYPIDINNIDSIIIGEDTIKIK